jgi:hypothetical protein
MMQANHYRRRILAIAITRIDGFAHPGYLPEASWILFDLCRKINSVVKIF